MSKSGYVYSFDVEMVGGSTWSLVADQRDIAQWEMQPFGGSYFTALNHRPTVMYRFFAWSASKRAGKYTAEFETWNDRDCLRVTEAADAPDDAEDPGRTAA